MIRPFAPTLFAFCLVAAVSAAAEAKTHVVASGETLAIVAKEEHLSVDDLARFNQLEGPAGDRLVLGQVLALDQTTADALPPPAPIDPEAADQLRTIITSSNPAAGADLTMWGATPQDPHASPVRRFADRIIYRASTIAMGLTRSALRFIGVPYVFGGTGVYGFDCSGYVQHVFAMLGVHLPRTADAQYYAGHTTSGRIVPGDLVFFQTYAPGPSHVGIYLGDGKFVHASSSHGVMVSRLRDSYWSARYLGAKRYVAGVRVKELTEATAY